MSLYDHIVACNTHDLGNFRPFVVAGERVGWVRHDLAGNLDRWPEIFDLAGDKVTQRESVGGVEDRTAAMAEVCEALVVQKLLPPNRAEQFPVMVTFGGELLMRLDRAWVPAFGGDGLWRPCERLCGDADRPRIVARHAQHRQPRRPGQAR